MKSTATDTKVLSTAQLTSLLETLKARFGKHKNRHKNIIWENVEKRLKANNEKLWSLYQMEITGGEPDVVGQEGSTGAFIFCDCSAESPKERRSLCYDQEALEERKENKPQNSALAMAAAMGIEILTEEQYRSLQELGQFDLKTSSWIQTPEAIRSLGGALFCDRRYNTVFLYHNGASSYYGSRGFRGRLIV